VLAHGDTQEGKWRGNWQMEWVASTLHTTSEHGVSSITTADAHTSAASSRLNWRPTRFKWTRPFTIIKEVDSSWNVMAHCDAQEGKWRGNWWIQWVASTLHTTLEHGASSITTTDAHTSASGSRLNWRPSGFKWTCPFRWKTKPGFCVCAITFQTHSTTIYSESLVVNVRINSELSVVTTVWPFNDWVGI